jgi:hypothetical protein
MLERNTVSMYTFIQLCYRWFHMGVELVRDVEERPEIEDL